MTSRVLPCFLVLLAGCLDADPEEVGTTAGEVSVTWTNLVGVSASGNDLTKTASTSAWDAGAVSVENLTGDGYIELTVGETGTNKAAGLSSGDGGQHYNDIDFALRFATGGAIQVYEGGVLRGSFGTYQAGDRFRVEVEGGVVTYSRSGQAPFYTSAVAPSFPLLVDTAFYTPGATITDVELVATGLTWQNLVRVAVSDDSLTKTANTTGWTAGASSVQTLAGDGFLEFAVADATTAKAAGLSSGDSDQSYTDIDYGLRLNANGIVYVYEAGVLRGNFGSYLAGDRFRVEVSGGVVRYSRSGAASFYTSAVAPSFPLLVDTAFSTPGATLSDVDLVATALTWQNVVGVAVSGDDLTKTDGTSGWTAGASSVEALDGDGILEFAVADNTTAKAAGLSSGDSDQSYTDIDYALRFTANGAVQIYESGILRGIFGNYMAGDRFRVEVAAGAVSFSRNGGPPFYTSAVDPTFPLLVDTSFSTPGATLQDLALSTNACPAYDGTGVVCGGSFTVDSPESLAAIATCARITGNLTISSPGMSNIALPVLERIDGYLRVLDTTSMVRLQLPALKEIAGGTSVLDLGAVTEVVDLSRLRTVGGLQTYTRGTTDIATPCLDTAGSLEMSEWTATSNLITGPLYAPRLRLVNGSLRAHMDAPLLESVAGTISAGNITAPILETVNGSVGTSGITGRNQARLDAPSLTDVGGTVYYQDEDNLPALQRVAGLDLMDGGSIDLPALVEITGMLLGGGDRDIVPTASILDLPALERAGSILLLWDGLEQVSLPSLQAVTRLGAIGGVFNIGSSSITEPVTLPSLSLVKGKLVVAVPLVLPALTEVRSVVDLRAPLSAPALTSVLSRLNIDDFDGTVFLPSLASVGAIVCNQGAVASIDLPALTQVGGSIQVHGCESLSFMSMPLVQSIDGVISVALNSSLTSIDLGSLTSLGSSLSIYQNPVLTNCYATNIHDQLVASGWTGTATIYGNNGTGSCP